MMTFKNSSGFTLIEVMLALGIAAVLLTSIFILQSGALTGVLKYSTNYERLLQAKNFMFVARNKREEAKNPPRYHLEKKENDPETYLRYNFGSTEQGIFKNLENLYFEKVEIMHDARQKEPSATLFTLVYQPESK